MRRTDERACDDGRRGDRPDSLARRSTTRSARDCCAQCALQPRPRPRRCSTGTGLHAGRTASSISAVARSAVLEPVRRARRLGGARRSGFTTRGHGARLPRDSTRSELDAPLGSPACGDSWSRTRSAASWTPAIVRCSSTSGVVLDNVPSGRPRIHSAAAGCGAPADRGPGGHVAVTGRRLAHLDLPARTVRLGPALLARAARRERRAERDVRSPSSAAARACGAAGGRPGWSTSGASSPPTCTQRACSARSRRAVPRRVAG